MNNYRFRLFGLASCLCICLTPAFADGPLDPAFANGDGLYAFPIGTGSAVPLSVTQDASGRIITAGYSRSLANTDVMTVTRHYMSTGWLDNDFYYGGIAASPFGDTQSHATSVAVDHSGRIVTVGYVQLAIPCGDRNSVYFYAVARFHGEDAPADAGKPDASFGGPWSGGTGVLVGDCQQGYQANGLAVDAKDYITAVGGAWDNAHTHSVVGLVRWTSAGATDNTFGSFGIVTTPYSADAVGKGVVLDSLNRAWVVAEATTTSGKIGLVLRYTASGALDTTFGASGIASTPTIGTNGHACCIALDSEGRAVIAGDAEAPGEANRMFVARFTPSGSLDTTFGTGGLSKPPVSSWYSYSYGLTLDQRGRAIVAGGSGDNFLLGSATLVHFNLDGSLNTTVGYQGIYKTTFGLDDAVSTAVMLDSSNRPVIAIFGRDRDGYVPGLIRYDELFGDGFD